MKSGSHPTYLQGAKMIVVSLNNRTMRSLRNRVRVWKMQADYCVVSCALTKLQEGGKKTKNKDKK